VVVNDRSGPDQLITDYWRSGSSIGCQTGNESIEFPGWLIVCLFAAVLSASSVIIYLFKPSVMDISSIVWAAEMISVFLTFAVTILTFIHVWEIFIEQAESSLREVKSNVQDVRWLIKLGWDLLVGLVLVTSNFVPLVFGVTFLIWFQESYNLVESARYYLFYLSAITVSFALFAAIDFYFALKSPTLVKTRSLWALFIFADVPAFVGTFVVSLYFWWVFWHLPINEILDATTMVGGTTIFQLFYASLVILAVMTNWINYGFKKVWKQLHYAHMPDERTAVRAA
jgi:hypothetical protein